MPAAPLLQAQDGGLYGTTQWGGANNVGVLFRMNHHGQLTVLHSFVQDGSDGYVPAAGLMQDDNGDIWGTTTFGGALFSGTVFRLSKHGVYSVVHSFDGGAGANQSYAPLVQGRDGRLYGTTAFGGEFAQGCVFRLTGTGNYTVIHPLSGAEGTFAQVGLVRADDGNFYGTTVRGGDSDGGTALRVSPSGAFTRIYSFEPEPTMTGTGDLEVKLRVNGAEHALTIDPRVSLLDALREQRRLTGTKKGCDQGAYGACTVLVDGERINSCLALAAHNDGCEVTTIEGLGGQRRLSALQVALIEHDGFRCGYCCTSGQICSAVAMVSEFRCGLPSAVTRTPASAARSFSDDEIMERMSGNLCRCGAYNGIVDAIHATFDAEVAA